MAIYKPGECPHQKLSRRAPQCSFQPPGLRNKGLRCFITAAKLAEKPLSQQRAPSLTYLFSIKFLRKQNCCLTASLSWHLLRTKPHLTPGKEVSYSATARATHTEVSRDRAFSFASIIGTRVFKTTRQMGQPKYLEFVGFDATFKDRETCLKLTAITRAPPARSLGEHK